jgi:hypothetical protein
MIIPENLRDNLLGDLDDLGQEDIWRLRGNIQVLKNFIIQNVEKKDDEVLKNIDNLLGVSNDLYKFLTTIKGCVSSADFNKLARLLNTGGEAVRAIEEIVTAEDFNIADIVMSGMSMILSYAGNTAYITSALESCETQVNANSMILFDRMWNFIHEYNTKASPLEIAKINEAMNIFFKRLSNRDVLLTERITIIARLYQFFCMIYLAGLIRRIDWVKVKEA